ncbi:hypothetical protein CAC42_8094 [Sphaceloma murrayae]|uniref:Uncharacterized protein n=1 Tax=Sphaceloma murrayae TaxID=2082308 RepID=A0A2K1QR89_9PEZI|nr:hypothetical protein CAC42_8094 [Sphaceloma murrayae]
MQPSTQSSDQRLSRPDPPANMQRQTASRTTHTRSEESWIEIASQPSSSSLSSAADDIVTTGLRVQNEAISRRRRRHRHPAPTLGPQIARQDAIVGNSSSQEEYTESESESDRVMTSSNEGLVIGGQDSIHEAEGGMSDDDENRTAVNYPIRRPPINAFTPQPNAFSHPPAARSMRHASEPCPGSYFPSVSTRSTARSNARHSFSAQDHSHPPYATSPSQNAVAHHEATLRASLSTLLSCAAAARGLPKLKTPQPAFERPAPSRVQPNTLRLVPESQLPGAHQARQNLDPTFPPTIRQRSTSSTSASASANADSAVDAQKRKGRGSSKERRPKKARSGSASSYGTAYSNDEVFVSPTLLTWVVSAGVVVVLSAISFSAGYAVGREAGKVEVGMGVEGTCGSEVSRGLGLRRLKFVQA